MYIHVQSSSLKTYFPLKFTFIEMNDAPYEKYMYTYITHKSPTLNIHCLKSAFIYRINKLGLYPTYIMKI